MKKKQKNGVNRERPLEGPKFYGRSSDLSLIEGRNSAGREFLVWDIPS